MICVEAKAGRVITLRNVQITVPRALVTVGLALLVIGVGLGVWGGWTQYQRSVQSGQVQAYTTRIVPLSVQAGRLVRTQIGPAISGYRSAHVTSGQLVTATPRWEAFFVETRAAYAKVPHQGVLQPVAAEFDKALSEYAAAMHLYGEAAIAPGDKKTALAPADGLVKLADADYAKAARRLGCLREDLGLSSVTQFKVTGTC